MKSFVITLVNNTKSVKSTNQVIKTAKEVGYNEPIEIFEAVTPDKWEEILPYNNNFGMYPRPDNVGACFASHYLLWKKCVELNEPILILEHDAIFVDNIPDIDFEMCVSFGRPSYVRIWDMSWHTPKEGLSLPLEDNFLGHHAYAIKPEAASILCDDVKGRELLANDIWMDKHTYPWLQEYRPFPIWADTNFSTVQAKIPNSKKKTPAGKVWESFYKVGSFENQYMLKHYPQILTGPQSKKFIDV